MGKFIISRSLAGDRFVLQSDHGQTLAMSRHYATLDACKKGIASLIVNAPVMPVRDATVGEYGPNPKFEIVAGENGFAFLVKSANGKSVINSPDYATKKACLRAIAMLRRGVCNYEILFHSKEGFTPLTMKAPAGATARSLKQAREIATTVVDAKEPLEQTDLIAEAQDYESFEQDCESLPQSDMPEENDTLLQKPHTAEVKKVETAAPQAPQTTPPMPRIIRLQSPKREVVTPTAATQKAPKSGVGAGLGRQGILSRLFKNK
jgi:uncharacterized protein YegP (UPF0339 family)